MSELSFGWVTCTELKSIPSSSPRLILHSVPSLSLPQGRMFHKVEVGIFLFILLHEVNLVEQSSCVMFCIKFCVFPWVWLKFRWKVSLISFYFPTPDALKRPSGLLLNSSPPPCLCQCCCTHNCTPLTDEGWRPCSDSCTCCALVKPFLAQVKGWLLPGTLNKDLVGKFLYLPDYSPGTQRISVGRRPAALGFPKSLPQFSGCFWDSFHPHPF